MPDTNRSILSWLAPISRLFHCIQRPEHGQLASQRCKRNQEGRSAFSTCMDSCVKFKKIRGAKSCRPKTAIWGSRLAWRLFVSPSPLHPKEQCSLNILVSNYNTPRNSPGVQTRNAVASLSSGICYQSSSCLEEHVILNVRTCLHTLNPHLLFLSISSRAWVTHILFHPEFLAQAVPSRFTVLSLQWGVLKLRDLTARLVKTGPTNTLWHVAVL